MTDPHASTVSIVLPTLGDAQRLRVSLPGALAAIESRGFDPDEILVVDDSGAERAATVVPEILAEIDSPRSNSVHVLSTSVNSGFAAAVLLGAQKARGSLLLVLQDDVELGAGALGSLASAMKRDDVFAAGPRIELAAPTRPFAAAAEPQADADGDAEQYAAPEVRIVDDRLEVRELAADVPKGDVDPVPVTFVPATAVMLRRKSFVEQGGFDTLLAPFSWEDVDLGLSARRRGERVVRVPSAAVLHHAHLPSIWDHVPDGLARAVTERNRLLTRWKHLATRAEATEHLVSLWRGVLEAGLAGDRETLASVCLAFERLNEVTASRANMQGATRELSEVLGQ